MGKMSLKTQRLHWALVLALLVAWPIQPGAAASNLPNGSLGQQVPNSVAPGAVAVFPFTVTHIGYGAISAHFEVSSLPTGAVACYLPRVLDAKPGGVKTGVIAIRVGSLTSPGDYPFTLTVALGQSPRMIRCEGVLKVGPASNLTEPMALDIPLLLSDGTLQLSGHGPASIPFLIQATTNLACVSCWETVTAETFDSSGLFCRVDQDSTNYPARFYRLAR